MNSYITDSQLVEGLIAALVWGIFWIYLRNYLNLPGWIEGAIAWILVWLCRKFGVSMYNTFKQNNKIRDKNFKIF